MTKLFLYYSLICCLSYLVASVIFFYKYDSIGGGIWAAFAGFMAGLTFYLYKLSIENKLYNQFTLQCLDYVAIISYVICLIGLGFGVWYLFAIIYWKASLLEPQKSTVYPCVFSILTGKWGFHLYRAAMKSINCFMESAYVPLVREI